MLAKVKKMVINEDRNIGSRYCPFCWNLVFICTVILVSGAVFLGNKVLPKLTGRPVHLSVLRVLANREEAPAEL